MSGEAVQAPSSNGTDVEQQPAYRRAVGLKMLGLDSDAARELAALTDHYSHNPEVLMTLSMRLNEAGAYHHALRLARAQFRDKLERTGGAVAPGLWSVAYPTGLIPIIKTQELNGVSPYLVAAIIREESQYDVRAVSRVGAMVKSVTGARLTFSREPHWFPYRPRDVAALRALLRVWFPAGGGGADPGRVRAMTATPGDRCAVPRHPLLFRP